MMNELVSIIMPSYNTGKFIRNSIESVINQTYKNWELIIVDDCSEDDTADVVLSFNESRIKYFMNAFRSGAAISRNRALREARGRWIAFLDSDDIWLPLKLEKQITFMKKNNYSFSYTKYEEVDESGKKTGVVVSGPRQISKFGMYNYCWPGCLTVMYDAKQIGLVQIANIKKNNDYAMWLKVCKRANCYLLDESLALYRRGREGSVSSHSVKTMIGWHYKLFRDAENYGRIMSIFATVRNIVFGVYKKKRYVCKEKGDLNTVEVLLSTMDKENIDFISSMNIKSDAVIVNQTNKKEYCEFDYNKYNVILISDTEKGLSKSRNLALQNAKADICLLCDDDIEYIDGYQQIVKEAFKKINKADIIIFDSLIIDRDGKKCTKGFERIKKVPRFKTYSSVLIAFNRKKVIDNGIAFNTDFGTGSGLYSMCEDSVFLRDCYKKGLRAYVYPAIIHKCTYGESSWFDGYNKKYFYDIGAYLKQSFGFLGNIVKWYYPFRMKNLSNLSPFIIIKEINDGMRGYKKRIGYDEFYKNEQDS